MPIPLLLVASVFLHKKPIPPVPAAKAGVQIVIIAPPGQSRTGRALMPLRIVLRLDEQAVEEREQQDLIGAINTDRMKFGEDTLKSDPVLTEAARAHCQEMCRLNYFAHLSPTAGFQTPMDRYSKALDTRGIGAPNTMMVGENIFYSSVTDAAHSISFAHRSLMESPGHRANILNASYLKIGVGLSRDVKGGYWVTEMFLRDTD